MRLFFMILAWLIIVVTLSCDKDDDANDAGNGDAAEVVDADFADAADVVDGDVIEDASEEVDGTPDATDAQADMGAD